MLVLQRFPEKRFPNWTHTELKDHFRTEEGAADKKDFEVWRGLDIEFIKQRGFSETLRVRDGQKNASKMVIRRKQESEDLMCCCCICNCHCS